MSRVIKKSRHGRECASEPRLTRRLFLGGAGAAISLPFLPSLMRNRALAQSALTPKRLVAWYVPCGINMSTWTPSTTGSDYTLTPALTPLQAVKSDVLVLTGLANRPAQPDGAGDHASGTGAFITAAHPYKTDGADIRNGVSMDQVAAKAIGQTTKLPSLELGIDGGESIGGCDSGYSCAYARNIAWADEDSPVPKLVDPRLVFDRMFEGFDATATAAEQEKRRVTRKSVLDYALEQANGLHTKLGIRDQRKLDEYLTAVRETERRLEAASYSASCTKPARPEGGLARDKTIDLMSDLQVLALQCDITRVITFMMANAGSYNNFPFLSISEGHHELSHHQGNAETLAKLTRIDTWEVERFAYFLTKLKSITEADGSTLLDNCAIFLSSEIADGDRHNHNNMPVLVAGNAGGSLKTGQHIRFTSERKFSELFITLMQSVGVTVSRFGDGSTPLTDIQT